jgi:hypothetical protein
VGIRSARCLLVLLACVACNASWANAQRFEGIITFKVTAPANGRSGRPPGRGGEAPAGSGTATAQARGSDLRGGAGRATGRGETPPAETRAQSEPRSTAGRGDEALTAAQVDAMRSALSNGLQNVEYMTRRGRVRIGIGGVPGGQSAAAMIYVPEEGVMFTLLPAVSMYSETVLADIQALRPEQAAGATPARPEPRPPIVTHTKKFELVAGHKCEHVMVEYAKLKTDICMGKGLGVFVMPATMGRA